MGARRKAIDSGQVTVRSPRVILTNLLLMNNVLMNALHCNVLYRSNKGDDPMVERKS